MRKVSVLLVVALIATSCAVGTYHPYARNNFGAQSTVVLDKANFRVVRDVEAIVDVNNTRLSRADVASSAYGELLRKAQLTGSQVLINVVIEEVRRESAGFFRLLFGMPKRVQHVAARATIIEFLDENGNPTVSQSYRPNISTETIGHTSSETSITATTQQPIIIEEKPSNEDIKKIENTHDEIDRLVTQLYWEGIKTGIVFNCYKNIYKSLSRNIENVQNIIHIQSVVLYYYENKTKAYPDIEYKLKNASSTEAEIAVFLSYYKEQ